MIATKQQFWTFSSKCDSTRGRMIAEVLLDNTVEFLLWQGKPASDVRVPIPVPARIVSATKIEDMPWCGSLAPLVSDALRAILCEHGNGALEFLPVAFDTQTPSQCRSYRIVNCLTVVECHDMTKSTISVSASGRRMIGRFALDPQMVPVGIHIFRVKYSEARLIVTDELKLAIESAGLTGCRFFDTDTPIPLW